MKRRQFCSHWAMLWIFILTHTLAEVLYVPRGQNKAIECSFEGLKNQLLRVANRENILFIKLKNKTTSQIVTDPKNSWKLLNPERLEKIRFKGVRIRGVCAINAYGTIHL